MLGPLRRGALVALPVVALAACGRGGAADAPAAATRADTAVALDSIPEERPDSIKVSPPDSATMMLSLLPAAPQPGISGEAGAMGARAVFVPRSQRWFMARPVDSLLALDIGRIDGGVGTTDDARAAFDRMVAALSPVQAGMAFTLHAPAGAVQATVTRFHLTGRRIVAVLDAAVPVDGRAFPVEWRGRPPVPLRTAALGRCEPGDTVAITTAISRYAPADTESLSVLRGCFGDFRALIVIRPRSVTPETVEKVVLVRASGGTRAGKLRDLSYPLHDLVGTLDSDGDGTDEIVVHSVRAAMETWAALRMTDSVSFTRFASGFTIEKR